MPLALQPLPYHIAVRDFLKGSDADLWAWFAGQRRSPKFAEDVRFELLKSAYRIERDAQPALYGAAEQVAGQLGIAAPLTIYQAQNPRGLNAELAYVPGEVHLILHGPITAQLTPVEARGLFGHELSHYLLWEAWNGEMLVTSDILQALVTDEHAHPAHFATWRLFRLYTEIFCDRGALAVTQDMLSVVSGLVKTETGVPEIDPQAYLRQADEIFAKEDAGATGITHPETFIRARAARLVHEAHPVADRLIAKMIEGRPGMDELDLLEQERVAALTRRLLDVFLCRKWLQNDLTLAHARLYFEDYLPPAQTLVDPSLAADLRLVPESVGDYYCYVLLDFITADRDIDEPSLAAALLLAEQLGIKLRLKQLARKELKLRKNQLEKVDDGKTRLLAEADQTTQIAP
jgi:hypothetical protein